MIITSDLHFTARPEDEYRWGVIEFLKQQASQTKEDYLYILGDLTDAKDRHSSILVNRLVLEILNLRTKFEAIFILKGNHDYIDKELPYFDFLNEFDDVHFVNELDFLSGPEILLLPHTRTPESWDDRVWELMNASRFVFLHQTFEGAKASNGAIMDGMKPSAFKDIQARIISGDIHVPQNIGNITYVGSPYHVHFGDSFKPRILRIEDDKETDLYFDTIKKMSVKINKLSELDDFELRKGDQLKITYILPRTEFNSWAQKKEEVVHYCSERGYELFGVEIQERKRNRLKNSPQPIETKIASPEEVYTAYCAKENLNEVLINKGRTYL